MSTKKQERARARRRFHQRQALASRRNDERARLRVVAVIGAVVTALCLILWWAGSLFSRVDSGTTLTSAGCRQPPAALGTKGELTLPDKALAAGKAFEATITTNCGDIVVTLDGAAAPQAVSSFVQLARADYWLNAPCHRVLKATTASLLQCGDPTGTGQGTPGYGFGVENAPTDGVYERGRLAMARTADTAAGSGGQFFIVDEKTTLPDPAGYSVFGTVTSGLDIVDKIVAAGVAGGANATDGAPAAPISILRVAVTEKKA